MSGTLNTECEKEEGGVKGKTKSGRGGSGKVLGPPTWLPGAPRDSLMVSSRWM